MNITTDNYEAYLLDYMEGNLGPDETQQLQAFVAAQGLDWDELTEDLPKLEAPQITFEGKDHLKKKHAVVPLYVKIASVAAVAGLLLTIGLWPDKSASDAELITGLSPIPAQSFVITADTMKLTERHFQFVVPQKVVSTNTVAFEKKDYPMLAELKPIRSSETQVVHLLPVDEEPDFALLTQRINSDLASILFAIEGDETFDDEEESLSLISLGLLRLTNGRHDNFASLIGAGVRKAQQDLTEVATDVALSAYYQAEERVEEMREQREEKHEKQP